MNDETDDETKPAAAQSDDDILEEARKRYKSCQDADGNNRIEAISDLNFLAGGENQWEPRAVAARKMDGRPIITVNSLPTYLHQVTNDQRMNTPSIKVHPAGGEANIETAKVRQGIIRYIEYSSNADVAYDTAVNSGAAVGFGYFRLITDYESDSSFDQTIKFNRIRNAMSVRIDPLSVEPDGSDMKYCFIELKMSKEAFKREWPDAKASTTSVFNDDTTYTDWLTDTEVLICDYYRIETSKAEVVLLSNGESGFKDDLLEMPPGVTVVKTRDGERCKTMLYKITGVDVLEKTEIKCKWIPVFPVYGDELDIEGKVIRSGIIRHAKGPKQMENVMLTAATEEVSLRAKSPYIGAEGQFQGHEDEWTQANNRAFPFLEYRLTSLDGHLAPPPQRNPMADVPSGLLQLMLHAADNVKKTTGTFTGTFAGRMGQRGTATSGVQEKAQQAEGDMASFHYTDGLTRTIRHAGRCINCMIPHYFDTERVVKIMGDDGEVTHAAINQPNRLQQPDPETGAIRAVLNDMTCGEYEVTVSAGPSYSTLRQESAAAMGEIMVKNPAAWGVFGDLFVRSQDWPNADKIADRVKKTIPPQLLEGEDKQAAPQPDIQTPQGPLPVAQVPQVLAQLTGQLQQMGEQLKAAAADKQHAELVKQQAEAMKQQAEIVKQKNEEENLRIEKERVTIEAFTADTERMTAEANKAKAERELLLAQHQCQVDNKQADADLLASGSDHIRAKIEAGEIQQSPSAEEIAALVTQMRPPPASGMTVRAPSGQIYDVNLKP